MRKSRMVWMAPIFALVIFLGLAVASQADDDPPAGRDNPNIEAQFQWWLEHKRPDDSWASWVQFQLAMGAPNPAPGLANPNIEAQLRWWAQNRRAGDSWESFKQFERGIGAPEPEARGQNRGPEASGREAEARGQEPEARGQNRGPEASGQQPEGDTSGRGGRN